MNQIDRYKFKKPSPNPKAGYNWTSVSFNARTEWVVKWRKFCTENNINQTKFFTTVAEELMASSDKASLSHHTECHSSSCDGGCHETYKDR